MNLKTKYLHIMELFLKMKYQETNILTCPRCEVVNVIENKYCSQCSYPLKPSAFDKIKIEKKIE